MIADAVPAPPLPLVSAPWTIRVIEGEADTNLVHEWNLRPHVAEFWDQAWSVDHWRTALDEQRGGDHSLPCLLSHDGVALAYLEVYRVIRNRLADCYPPEPHDLGVHIAIGDLSRTGRGLGRSALATVAEGLLAADPRCRRVVAEPDVGNVKSIKAFTAAGFTSQGTVDLPHKTAELLCFPAETGVPRR